MTLYIERSPLTPPLHPILDLYARHRRAIMTVARFTGLSPLNCCWGLVLCIR